MTTVLNPWPATRVSAHFSRAGINNAMRIIPGQLIITREADGSYVISQADPELTFEVSIISTLISAGWPVAFDGSWLQAGCSPGRVVTYQVATMTPGGRSGTARLYLGGQPRAVLHARPLYPWELTGGAGGEAA